MLKKIVTAPEGLDLSDVTHKSIFLAGSIEQDKAEKWQEKVIQRLSEEKGLYKGQPYLILNPRREEWDSTWEQRMSNSMFNEQVNWEIDMLFHSSHILMHFDPATKSPITLLELGMFAMRKAGKLSVSCPDGFWRKGNVEVVCNRFEIALFDSLDELLDNFVASNS